MSKLYVKNQIQLVLIYKIMPTLIQILNYLSLILRNRLKTMYKMEISKEKEKGREVCHVLP